MADLKRIQAKVNTVGERKEFGDKGFSKLDFSAQVNLKENGEVVKPAPVWTFEIFAKGESRLDAVVVPGRICEVEYEEKVRSSSDGSQTFTNRSVKQIYIDGKAQAERQGGGGYKGGGGYNQDTPEKRLSIEAQSAFNGVVALTVAGIVKPDSKDFGVAMQWALGKLLKDIGVNTAPITHSDTAKADPKPAPTPKPEPEPPVESEPDYESPFPEDEPELAQATGFKFDEVWLASQIKAAKWTISTLRSWITGAQKWLSPEESKGELKDFIPRLTAKQYESLCKHLQERIDLQ